MASKFGQLVERLTGAKLYFVPDGANIGTVETPDLVSITNKPSGTEWDDYDVGRVNKAKHTPKTKPRTREYYVPGRGYVEDSEDIVIQDAFEFTMIDFAAKLYDQLQFGMASEPVSGTPQQAFATTRRSKVGWARIVREDQGEDLCECEIWVRLSLATIPEDQNAPGDPVYRIAHLATGGALDIIEFNY